MYTTNWKPSWDWKILNRYGQRQAIAQVNMAQRKANFKAITIKPLPTLLGAEVENINFQDSPSDAQVNEIKAALLLFKVLIFKKQQVNASQFKTFMSHLGKLLYNPTLIEAQGQEDAQTLNHDQHKVSYENVWHFDDPWRPSPPWLTAIHVIDTPQGGNTLFSDMHCVYESLDTAMKDAIENVSAVYDLRCWYTLKDFKKTHEKYFENAFANFPPIKHRLVIHHPITKQKQLFISPTWLSTMIDHKDQPLPDIDALLQRLWIEWSFPDFQTRIAWDAGDIGIWDNLSTLHYASFDYWPQTRVIERMNISLD